jgi:hypothetical protein
MPAKYNCNVPPSIWRRAGVRNNSYGAHIGTGLPVMKDVYNALGEVKFVGNEGALENTPHFPSTLSLVDPASNIYLYYVWKEKADVGADEHLVKAATLAATNNDTVQRTMKHSLAKAHPLNATDTMGPYLYVTMLREPYTFLYSCFLFDRKFHNFHNFSHYTCTPHRAYVWIMPSHVVCADTLARMQRP